MMLDSLPHAIGVLTSADNGEEAYIPILRKDQPLPAVNAKPFFLADVDQPGITIVAVEDVGDAFPLQRLGEFTFLLHRLTDGEKSSLGGRRKVEVGFVVDESGIRSPLPTSGLRKVFGPRGRKERISTRAADQPISVLSPPLMIPAR